MRCIFNFLYLTDKMHKKHLFYIKVSSHHALDAISVRMWDLRSNPQPIQWSNTLAIEGRAWDQENSSL